MRHEMTRGITREEKRERPSQKMVTIMGSPHLNGNVSCSVNAIISGAKAL